MRAGGLPRLGDLLFVSVFAGCMLVGQRMLNVDGDLGRHLTLGTYMLEARHIPSRDVLSFSMAGASRPPYEWLAQIALAGANRLMGLDGVVLLAAGVIALAMLVPYLDGKGRSGAPLITVFFAIWATAVSSLHWLTRPHIFSFLFLAIWLLLLERLRSGDRRALWLLPVTMLFWANLHGGFVVGFLAWAAYLAGWVLERLRGAYRADAGGRLVLVGAASFGASLATPGFWSNWAAVVGNNSVYVLSRTAETLPVDFASPGSWPFLTLLVVTAGLAMLNRRSLAPAHGFLLLGLAAISIAIVRNIPLFAVAAVPILATWARQALGMRSPIAAMEQRIAKIESGLEGRIWPPLALLLGSVVIASHAWTTRSTLYNFDASVFPVRAVDWVEEHPLQGSMFNEVNWGGYLLYRLWPQQRVFIDSQSDFYGEQFFREYADVLSTEDGWSQRLDSLEITWIIIPPNTPLAQQIRNEGAWRLAYEDSTAVIFVRKVT